MRSLNVINERNQRLEVRPFRSFRLLFATGLLTVLASSALAQGGQVCLYEQPYYRGRSVCFVPGDRVSELAAVRAGWNDRASSIRIVGNVTATIYQHAGFTGASFYVDSNIPDLSRLRTRMPGGLGDEISSITVENRQMGRRSDYNEAFRLGQRDYVRGFRQNYRQHTSRYDRMGEAEFRRGYNEGYAAARSGRSPDPRFRTFREPNQR